MVALSLLALAVSSDPPQQLQQQQHQPQPRHPSGSRTSSRSTMAAQQSDGAPPEQAEIYTYESDSLVYAMNWSVRPDKRFRLAVGTFRQDTRNSVRIIQLDDEGRGFVSAPHLTFPHPYPPTKLQWVPDKDGTRPDLLASSGDHLRLWRVGAEGVRLEQLLSNNARSSDYVAPLTSFDWNDLEPRRLATCSIDTSVTVWDVERGAAEAQLIAHDREVYDINWGGAGVFATVSADGSVRVFDLRDKEHSTILYEASPDTPLLHLGWNKQDPRYMATLVMDSPKVIILDIRYPTVPVTQLQRHTGPVNALAWAPHSAHHICTAGQDHQALIWDLSAISQPGLAPPAAAAAAAAAGGGGGGAGAAGASGAASAAAAAAAGGGGVAAGLKLDPILAYNAGAEVTQLQWSSTTPDWVAINFANKTQILRV